jgi:uncharacterized protein (TIGR00730 family)
LKELAWKNLPQPDASHSYLLPVEDQEFLLREELRGLRFALEYSKADLLLRDWGIRSTIICFGSARVPSPEQVVELRHSLDTATDPQEKAMAERRLLLSPYYEEARRFARIASLEGGAIRPKDGQRDNVIATGGGPGIMEAANRGAYEVEAPTIGYNISLPFEQYPNTYTTPDLTFRFHYFAMRKMHLAMRANALAVFPGGYGTLDELFEILTLRQTGKSSPKPVVLVGREYWNALISFQAMVDHAMIDAVDLELFDIVDTAEEAWASLLSHGLAIPEAR